MLEQRWRRVFRAITPVTVIALILGIAIVAVLSDGYPTKDVDLHDGGVWVTKGDEGYAGRFNAPIEELDSAVLVASSSTGALDLLQEGEEVFLNTGTGQLRRMDVANVELPDEGARIPGAAAVALGGGVVAVLDPADGRLWIRPAEIVVSLDATSDQELLKAGGNSAVTVGRDGTVYVVSADTDVVTTIAAGPDGPGEVSTAKLDQDIIDPAITVVGDQPVVLSAGGRVIIPGEGEQVLPNDPAQVRLQQAGPAADVVAVATEAGLYAVSLDGDELRTLSTDGSGYPAAPVQLGGCVYGAWAVTPTLVKYCDGAPPIPPILLGASGGGVDRLEFRVNRDVIVLNQLGSGAVFTFDRAGENLGNWQNVKPPEPVDDPQEDPSSVDHKPQENTKPVARNDEFGARPGQATLLPVLENDGDPDGDFLVIKSVSSVGDGARIGVVANGQALQLVLPPGAKGTAKFKYTVNDGRGGDASASVTVNIRDKENTSPTLIPKRNREARVEQGGSVTFHVLTDWRDKEGDPLVLSAASTAAPDSVRFTPDGFVTFVDAGISAGKKTVQVEISDGRADPVKGSFVVNVLPPQTADGPRPHDDRVVGFAGQPLTIEPLLNDLDANTSAPDSSGPLRLSNILGAPTGANIARDFENGKFTFTAAQARTYYLTYEVTQGEDKAARARIRIDIQPSTSKNPPVAVADVAVLRGTAPGSVDVLANDTDLDGDVLVLSAVDTPEDAAITVSVIEHRWLRIVAPQAGTGNVAIKYTVSDGSATDVGVVTVSQLPPLADNQPPAPRDDVAKVRVGDVVSIDVLANDVDPEGGVLSLGPEVAAFGDPKGTWYVAGGTVRYQAPATPGTAIAQYKVLDPEGRQEDGQITVTIVDADPAQNQRPQPATLQSRVFAGTVTRIHVPLGGVDVDGDSVELIGPTVAPQRGRVVGQGIDYLDYEAYPGKGGTDTFTYVVRDPFGATGIGSVRVGIIAKPTENSAPVAVDDEYEVAPGAVVSAPVLANDSDVDGDALQLEALTVPNPAIGDQAKAVDNRIVVTAGDEAGASISIQYSVTDGRGLRSFATLRIVSRQDANVPPTAEDDTVGPFPPGATTVDVAVLDNDDDIDGPRSALVVEPVADESGLVATWVADAKVLRIPLADRPRQVVYRITDANGATATAFVHVPAKGDQAPYLNPDAPEITIVGGTDFALDLTRYVIDPEGKPIRLTAASGVSSSPRPGLTVVDGSVQATSLSLHADPAYSGPATLVIEVSDATATEGNRVSLALIVTVSPADGRKPTISCPPVEPRAGAPAVVVDLRTCVGGLTPQQRDALGFSDPSGAPPGVAVERDGVKLRISANRDAASGASGTLEFSIGGPWGTADATMTVRVRPASLARANTDEIERAEAGTPITIDVTANDTNPFPGDPLKVLKVTVIEGDVTAALEGDAHSVRIEPGRDFHGVATLLYELQDALNQPERVVLGRVIVHVVGRPDKPGPPRQRSVGANRAVLVYDTPNGNGADIDQYKVRDQDGKEYDCKNSTTCVVNGLDNGRAYRFQVQAHNVVDWSDWSAESKPITPDEKPDQPAAPRTKFGDKQITVTWTAPRSPGTPIKEYVVQRSPGGPGSTQTVRGATSVVFRDLTNGASYTFRVQAKNSSPNPSEWSPWSAAEVPAGPPLQVDAPTAQGVADGIGEQMTVQWLAPLDNGAAITRYTLTIRRAGAVIGTQNLGGDVTATTVDVENGIAYTFQVVATNKAGDSPISAQSAAAVAHGRPYPVTSFSVSDHDAGNAGYDGRVQYSLTPPDDNGLAITRYEFDVTGDGGSDYSSAATTGYITGLTNGTNYQVRIRACNDLCGNWSSASATVNPYGRPNTPGAGASTLSGTQLRFSWTVPATNGRPLDRIEFRLDGGGWQQRAASNGSIDQGGYGEGTTHTIEVRVFDTAGQASNIASASATTTPPAPPRVIVSKGASVSRPDCTHSSCAYVHVRMENFAAGVTYTLVSDASNGDSWSNVTRTTNASGVWEGDLPHYFGWPGEQVWVTAGGVESNHFTWS